MDHGLYQIKSVDQARHNSNATKPSENGQNKRNTRLIVRNPDDVFTSTSADCKWQNFALVHARLGHTSLSKMQHISLCQHPLPNTIACDICLSTKMHRLPFNKSNITTTFPFQLVHLDVWGPYRVANICGAHYFLTIVDDFTRTT